MEIRSIPADRIRPPTWEIRAAQPPKALRELQDSIAAVGLINPITVLAHRKDFEIVSGHRRYLACKALGWRNIPCIVTKVSDQDALLQRVHENLFRLDITPGEEAAIVIYLHLEQKMDIPQIQKLLRKSRAWVHDRIDIFYMDPLLKEGLDKKELQIATALKLAQITPAKLRDYYVHEARQNGCSPFTADLWLRDSRTLAALTPEEQERAMAQPPPQRAAELAAHCRYCTNTVPAGQGYMRMVCNPCDAGFIDAFQKAQQEPPIQ